MIHVLIPYIRQESQGNELELAIAGWIRHFKETFRITVIGDHHPCVERFGHMVHFLGQIENGRLVMRRENLTKGEVDEELFAQGLYTDGIPDPELLIRTSYAPPPGA